MGADPEVARYIVLPHCQFPGREADLTIYPNDRLPAVSSPRQAGFRRVGLKRLRSSLGVIGDAFPMGFIPSETFVRCVLLSAAWLFAAEKCANHFARLNLGYLMLPFPSRFARFPPPHDPATLPAPRHPSVERHSRPAGCRRRLRVLVFPVGA